MESFFVIFLNLKMSYSLFSFTDTVANFASLSIWLTFICNPEMSTQPITVTSRRAGWRLSLPARMCPGQAGQGDDALPVVRALRLESDVFFVVCLVPLFCNFVRSVGDFAV